MDDKTVKLLQRTALKSPFSVFLESLQHTYPQIGSVISYKPIMEGYEAANFILNCEKGTYVVKIFERSREKGNIESLTKILEVAPTVGVPTPELVQGKAGNLSTFFDETTIYYYLTKFWDGDNFQKKTPSLQEMLDVTTILAKLNTLTFPVVEAYDSWGNNNLGKEYEKQKDQLDPNVKEKILPVIEEVKHIDGTAFSTAVIHGDMQRNHVLWNDKGNYCILDFGCMRNDAKVFELSTYLGWFCLGEDTWNDRSAIIHSVISGYTGTHKLSDKEIVSLPALIRATYAAYFLRTSLLVKQGDTSTQTREWHTMSENLLKRAMDL